MLSAALIVTVGEVWVGGKSGVGLHAGSWSLRLPAASGGCPGNALPVGAGLLEEARGGADVAGYFSRRRVRAGMTGCSPTRLRRQVRCIWDVSQRCEKALEAGGTRVLADDELTEPERALERAAAVAGWLT